MSLKDTYLQSLTTLPVAVEEEPREGSVLTVKKDDEGNFVASWQPLPTGQQEVVDESILSIFQWDADQEVWYIGHGYTEEQLADVPYATYDEETGAWSFATGELVDTPSMLEQYDSYTLYEILATGFTIDGGRIILEGYNVFENITLTPQEAPPSGAAKGTIYYDSNTNSVLVLVST